MEETSKTDTSSQGSTQTDQILTEKNWELGVADWEVCAESSTAVVTDV